MTEKTRTRSITVNRDVRPSKLEIGDCIQHPRGHKVVIYAILPPGNKPSSHGWLIWFDMYANNIAAGFDMDESQNHDFGTDCLQFGSDSLVKLISRQEQWPPQAALDYKSPRQTDTNQNS